MPDYSHERADALGYAVELHKDALTCCDRAGHVIRDANLFYRWLTAPVRLVITRGPAVDQTTGKPTGNEGDTMKDSEKAQVTIAAMDAKGQRTDIGTDVTLTSSDESVVTVVTDPDGTVWLVARDHR